MSTATAIQQEQACAFLSDKEVAALVGFHRTTIWRWHSKELLPAPVNIGKTTRWRRADIEKWIEKGCPCRRKFEAEVA